MTTDRRHDSGFSLTELMVALVLIGILLMLAAPIYLSSRANAKKRACFASQRTLEMAAELYAAQDTGRSQELLAGPVNASHPLVTLGFALRAPKCPSAPPAADPANPTVAEGAYSFDAQGRVAACVFGDLGPHGHY